MKCNEVIQRLEKELPWKINKSLLHYYERRGLISSGRLGDSFNSRTYDDVSYNKLKRVILMAHIGIKLSDVEDYLEYGWTDKVFKQLQETRLCIAWLLGEV